MKEINPWKLLSTKIVYENPWIRVREDTAITPTGGQGIYGFVETKDSVCLVVVNDKDEIYLQKIFRYPLQHWHWELPGGGGDNEDPIVASKRELEEEAGIIAETWEKLGVSTVSNGLMIEKMHTYLARDLSFDGTKEVANETIIDSKFVSREELARLTANGEFTDGQGMTSLYFYENWLSRQKTNK